MSNTTTYRTCPRSGLQFEHQAEWLMKANAFVAVVWLLIGGILAIGVVLTRWPAVRWLEADTFYMVLTAHGIDMLIFWIIFFEIAVLYFCASTLLRCRIATPRIAWLRRRKSLPACAAAKRCSATSRTGSMPRFWTPARRHCAWSRTSGSDSTTSTSRRRPRGRFPSPTPPAC
jgi:hypothetical protein